MGGCFTKQVDYNTARMSRRFTHVSLQGGSVSKPALFSDQEKETLLKTWLKATHDGTDAKIAEKIYSKFFRRYPEMQRAFCESESKLDWRKNPEFKEFVSNFLSDIEMIIRLLDNVQQVIDVLEEVRLLHAYIQDADPSHYLDFTKDMYVALSACQGTPLTNAEKSTWRKFLSFLYQQSLPTAAQESMASEIDTPVSERQVIRDNLRARLQEMKEIMEIDSTKYKINF